MLHTTVCRAVVYLDYRDLKILVRDRFEEEFERDREGLAGGLGSGPNAVYE